MAVDDPPGDEAAVVAYQIDDVAVGRFAFDAGNRRIEHPRVPGVKRPCLARLEYDRSLGQSISGFHNRAGGERSRGGERRRSECNANRMPLAMGPPRAAANQRTAAGSAKRRSTPHHSHIIVTTAPSAASLRMERIEEPLDVGMLFGAAVAKVVQLVEPAPDDK